MPLDALHLNLALENFQCQGIRLREKVTPFLVLGSTGMNEDFRMRQEVREGLTIQWASDTKDIFRGDMRVDHRRLEIPVPQQFLDGPDVIAPFKQMRGKAVP